MKPFIFFNLFIFLLGQGLVAQNRDTSVYNYILIDKAMNDTAEVMEYDSIFHFSDTFVFVNFLWKTDTFVIQDSNIYLVKNGGRYLFFNKSIYENKIKIYNIHSQLMTIGGGAKIYYTELYQFIPKEKGYFQNTEIPYIMFEVTKSGRGTDDDNYNLDKFDPNEFHWEQTFNVFFNPYLGILRIDPCLGGHMMELQNVDGNKYKLNCKKNHWFPD